MIDGNPNYNETIMPSDKLNLVDIAKDRWFQRIYPYKRGSILFWQGDPVEQIYLVISGAVKSSSISLDGKIYSYGIYGAGQLLGAQDYLLDGEHKTVAEVLEKTDLLSIPLDEFDYALTNVLDFSTAVMKELARQASESAGRVRELSFLDVQQRLKHSLITLANDHGIRTESGIAIDLKITQDEIGSLVSANRTTIAECLSELRSEGFLWKEGGRLVIIPPEHREILDSLTDAVFKGNDQDAEKYANTALEKGVESQKALEALSAGMKMIDRAFSRGEMDLPDVVLAASAMKQALPIIEANLGIEHSHNSTVGTVVIGTVFGDIHDIGKTIVAMLLRARNFHVIDLGVNVPTDQFIDAVIKFKPDILALSALTTATSEEIKPVIELLKTRKVRDQVSVMVGGGAMSEEYATRLGADGYHATAQGAVETAWKLCTWNSKSAR
jgi:methanogenic corrinoid protein MtbC1